jgi:FkbM family methyltransferase
MKKIIKSILKSSGYEIRNLDRKKADIATHYRPTGRMDYLLEDLKKRGLDCQTILDVGANVTDWSRMAKKIFPSANFCLIEPQIEMKDALEGFCKEFENSVYFLAGAGAKKDVLTMTVYDDLVGSSFLPKSDNTLANASKQREIQIVTIDDLIESGKMKLPELIKLDIQGFELQALKGATKTFGYTEVYILEVSLFSFPDLPGIPLFSDVIIFMLERDYLVYDFPGFYRRPLDGALAQCDICFVKRNGFLRSFNSWF